MAWTNKQRKWFHRVYGNRCAFHEIRYGVWRRCTQTERLQVHHIVPTRAAKRWLPEFERNRCLNGIPLCLKHHCLVHPDLDLAFQQYRAGDKQSFKEIIHDRDVVVDAGEIYWDSQWDWMFHRIAKRFVFRYLAKHPDDKFPEKSKRWR